MKKTNHYFKAILILAFTTFNLFSFGQKKVRVSTIDEFFDAIGNNTTIELELGNYDISKLDGEKKSNYAKLVQVPIDENGGVTNQFLIKGVSNLKIIGIGKKQSKIYTPSPVVTVLSFENCKNVIVDNIDIGHKAVKGGCSADVIDINDSENFLIKNSILYGSGYIGIGASIVTKLSILKSTITDCSYKIFSFDNCMNSTIDSCSFTKCSGGVIISGCIGLKISNSDFTENTNEGKPDLNYFTYLFEISSSSNIKLNKTVIEGNITSYFAKNSQLLSIDDLDFKENKFIKPFEE